MPQWGNPKIRRHFESFAILIQADGQNPVPILVGMTSCGPCRTILDLAAGHGPESWVALPRYHHQYLPDAVYYEPGALDAALRGGLERLGHRLVALDSSYGDMQAVYWDKVGERVLAASDPRGEGESAVVEIQNRVGKAMESQGQ